MTRDAMTAIIHVVRGWIGDKATPPQFSDLDIQVALDGYRVYREVLLPYGKELVADVKFWDNAVLVTDLSGNTLSPTLSNPLSGAWSLSQEANVVVRGYSYDANAAAADLLEMWAALGAAEYDFSASGDSFKRSQTVEARLKLAQLYRSRQLAQGGMIERNDVNPIGYLTLEPLSFTTGGGIA